MTQDVEELPDEIVRALFELGGRKLVFVEGPDDEEVFKRWFAERQADVLFYPAIGVTAVQERLEQVAAFRPDVSVFGIRDRDFSSDEAVQAALTDPAARLFILTRYSIENYLLEPQALFDEVATFLGAKTPVHNALEVEEKLLDLCRRLQTLMAANWLLITHARRKLPAGFNQISFEELAAHVADELGCDADRARQLLTERLAVLQPAMQTLETAHTQISGKHLLHHFYVFVAAAQRGLMIDHLRRLLIRRIKEIGAVHSDLRYLVETRILGDP